MMDYILDGILMMVDLTNIILCYTQILRKELCNNKRRIIVAYVGAAICSGIYTFCSTEAWSIFIEIDTVLPEEIQIKYETTHLTLDLEAYEQKQDAFDKLIYG